MKTLTLPQASMLYGNGYQLWDGENVIDLKIMDNNFFFVTIGNKHPSIEFTEIGTDYKIIVRKNDAITKPLEDGTIPIIECARIAYPDYDFRLPMGVKNSLIARRKSNECLDLIFSPKGSHFHAQIGGVYQEIQDIRVPNQRQLFQYLESKHFQLELPDELCVSMEEINIKK